MKQPPYEWKRKHGYIQDDPPMAIIFTRAHVTDTLTNAWLQHLRDFDAAHPGCHFEVMADVPDTPLSKLIEMIQVNPDLDFQALFQRAPK